MSAPARLPEYAVALVTIVFAYACAVFVWQPTLATFADDSVSYLVMAQVFSPWQPAAPAVAAAFAREAFYPPLFPAVLALAGAAHQIAWAHVLTALLLAAWLPLVYLVGVRWLDDRRAAAVAVLCVALLPSLWVNAKGILSEPLFGLLLLATFCVLEAGDRLRGRLVMLALLMAALASTRSAALPVIAVYALWVVTRRGVAPAMKLRELVPVLAAFAAYGLWVLLRPAATEDNYARIALANSGAFFSSPFATAGASLLRQANAMAEGWIGSLLLYWVEGRPVRLLLAGAVGVLALAGMALRVRDGRPDGWMVAGYLATLLAWPFYDQMGRFLFPILPVLLLYAFVASATLVRALGRPPALGAGVLSLLLLSLTVPALAFIQQRSAAAGPFREIVDWYRTPGLDQARARAQVQLDLFADMEEIRKLTAAGDRVMWVAPAYLALLADRRGIAAPDRELEPAAYREAVRASGADYAFLSAYHPRDTLRDAAWQAGTRALAGHAEAVHVHAQPGGGPVTSILLKVRK